MGLDVLSDDSFKKGLIKTAEIVIISAVFFIVSKDTVCIISLIINA